MGNKKSKAIKDRFTTYEKLESCLRAVGLESCQLIVGVDYTRSNTTAGGYPYYEHNNLHHISSSNINPYQQVLSIMCQSLANFDDDQLIDVYGFGDAVTANKAVFSFMPQPCYKLEGVLECYNRITPMIQLSGPTSFTPIIRQAIDLTRKRKSYHILLIITDGCVTDPKETTKTIIEASQYPLSIICIGVGKGPWENMKKMDDDIPRRKFDNFQFVNFHQMMKQCENEQVEFARQALMEIPDQYNYIKNHILNK